MATKIRNNTWILIPCYGICLFVLLYIIATFYYPGGSDIDKSSEGFSLAHNYWCELMAPAAKNGQANAARPVALTAMAVLALSLSIFWFYASAFFNPAHLGRKIILIAGIGSMITVVFLSTGLHDTIINISGALGCVAIIAILIALYKKRSYQLFGLGIICLLLCALNNYVYYTGHLFDYLAIIQKISFLVFFIVVLPC